MMACCSTEITERQVFVSRHDEHVSGGANWRRKKGTTNCDGPHCPRRATFGAPRHSEATPSDSITGCLAESCQFRPFLAFVESEHAT